MAHASQPLLLASLPGSSAELPGVSSNVAAGAALQINYEDEFCQFGANHAELIIPSAPPPEPSRQPRGARATLKIRTLKDKMKQMTQAHEELLQREVQELRREMKLNAASAAGGAGYNLTTGNVQLTHKHERFVGAMASPQQYFDDMDEISAATTSEDGKWRNKKVWQPKLQHIQDDMERGTANGVIEDKYDVFGVLPEAQEYLRVQQDLPQLLEESMLVEQLIKEAVEENQKQFELYLRHCDKLEDFMQDACLRERAFKEAEICSLKAKGEPRELKAQEVAVVATLRQIHNIDLPNALVGLRKDLKLDAAFDKVAKAEADEAKLKEPFLSKQAENENFAKWLKEKAHEWQEAQGKAKVFAEQAQMVRNMLQAEGAELNEADLDTLRGKIKLLRSQLPSPRCSFSHAMGIDGSAAVHEFLWHVEHKQWAKACSIIRDKGALSNLPAADLDRIRHSIPPGVEDRDLGALVETVPELRVERRLERARRSVQQHLQRSGNRQLNSQQFEDALHELQSALAETNGMAHVKSECIEEADVVVNDVTRVRRRNEAKERCRSCCNECKERCRSCCNEAKERCRSCRECLCRCLCRCKEQCSTGLRCFLATFLLLLRFALAIVIAPFIIAFCTGVVMSLFRFDFHVCVL